GSSSACCPSATGSSRRSSGTPRRGGADSLRRPSGGPGAGAATEAGRPLGDRDDLEVVDLDRGGADDLAPRRGVGTAGEALLELVPVLGGGEDVGPRQPLTLLH